MLLPDLIAENIISSFTKQIGSYILMLLPLRIFALFPFRFFLPLSFLASRKNLYRILRANCSLCLEVKENS